jgi:ADP-ribose pyrophosphatase YjhB (NUDIX family)
VHLLLLRDGEVLLLRRHQTGYEDGNYGVVAGHVEGNETARQAMSREALEEAGLAIDPEALELCHVTYRKAADERVSVFFTTMRWRGEPQNMEPARCSGLAWFDLDRLPENMVPCVRQAIEAVGRGDRYSEFGW